MEAQKSDSVDYFRLVRRIVVHHWRAIVIGLLAVTIPTVALVLFSTENLYEASATLFLLPEKSDPPFLREFTSPEATAVYVVILKSRSLAQAIIEALPAASREELTNRVIFHDYLLMLTNGIRRLTGGEAVVYSPSEIAIRELQEARMSFNVTRDGTVTITAVAFSPRVAMDLANTYVDVLLSRSSSFARQQARGTRELLENLLVQAKSSQADAEEAMRRYQQKSGPGFKVPDESKVDLTTLAQIESQMGDLQVSREIAEGKLAYLKGDKRAGGELVGIDPNTQVLQERLSQLETKLAGLTEKYTEQHPSVQTTRSEIQETQEKLAAALQPRQTPKPTGAASPLKPLETAQLSKQMAALQVEVVSLKAREQLLQQRADRIKRSLSAMNAREQEYSAVMRPVLTQAKLTEMISEKLAAARINEQTHIRSIQVIDLANLPKQPSPRQSLKFLAFGLLGGLAVGIGAATLREYTTQVVETEQDVIRATGLAVLGAIPIADRSEHRALNGDRREDVPALFGIGDDHHSLPADACRAIRTALDCQDRDRPLKTFLVTSPGPHEGKSTVLLNLARAFLEADRQLLVIDADLRRPSLHRTLDIPNEVGLADMLRAGTVWPEAFRGLETALSFVPSGIRPANPSRLLSSRHMATVLDFARQRADIVLLDAPPVLAVSDCLPMSRRVDGVILVVRFGVTQIRSLQRAKTQLDKVGARIVGVVINGLSRRETRHYYSEYTHYAGLQKRRKKRRQRK
jgi:succinoglycan biosynthesis transport protein ExoP